MAELTGKTLGKYQVMERLGHGGMAEVYKAYHSRLDRYVALKVMYSHLAGDEGFQARFEREARAVAALRHPNITLMHDFDVEGDIFYMVIEYIDGQSLQTRLDNLAIQRQRLQIPEALQIFRQVASALDYAHKQNMLHRDVKPANVLLDKSGRAFLSDFGIVRMLGEQRQTTTGVLMGTPAYLSPEQSQGQPASTASDIYALGVLLYEMVTGRVPFNADTPLAILHQHIYAVPPPPHMLRPDLPPALENVILKALAKNPQQRYATAGEMLSAAEAALAHRPPAPAPLQAAQPAAVPIAATVVAPSAAPAPQPPTVQAQAPQAAPAAAIVKPVGAATPPLKEAAQPKPAVPAARRPAWVIPAVVGALALIAVLVGLFVWPGLARSGPGQPEPTCATWEECEGNAIAALDRTNPEEAIGWLDRALDMIPPDMHPPGAHLWCLRGDANNAMGNLDPALHDYQACIDWTQGDPALDPMRRDAQQKIDQLNANRP